MAYNAKYLTLMAHGAGQPMDSPFLNGIAIMVPDERGRRVRDDSFLLLLNASGVAIEWRLPESRYGREWTRCLDTGEGWVEGEAPADGESHAAGVVVEVPARTFVGLRRVA